MDMGIAQADAWDDVKPVAGLFLNLKEDQMVSVFVLGAPRKFFKRYVEAKKRNIILDIPFEKGAPRYAISVFSVDEGKVKVLEASTSLMLQIKSIREEVGLNGTMLKIKRTGTKQQTKYLIIPFPNNAHPAVTEELPNLAAVFPNTSPAEIEEILGQPIKLLEPKAS